ncbi:MAG: hypothetical protein KDK48_02360 [Chlamydiia bacterium]|nr:hypothetical protein [Chlamydiia bacterium]
MNYERETNDHSLWERVGEIALNVLVLGGLFFSLSIFPELSVIGFVAGLYYSDEVRELSNRVYTVIRSLNLFYWIELLAMGVVAGPMMIIGLPIYLGSYMWWSVDTQSNADPHFFKKSS